METESRHLGPGLLARLQERVVVRDIDFFAVNLSAASLSDEGFLGFIDASPQTIVTLTYLPPAMPCSRSMRSGKTEGTP